MENCNKNWFILCLALCILLFIALVMSFGYNFWLDKRTVKLEKKNGKEQHEIDKIKKELWELKKELKRSRN